jgi:hypothetical protein
VPVAACLGRCRDPPANIAAVTLKVAPRKGCREANP